MSELETLICEILILSLVETFSLNCNWGDDEGAQACGNTIFSEWHLVIITVAPLSEQFNYHRIIFSYVNTTSLGNHHPHYISEAKINGSYESGYKLTE